MKKGLFFCVLVFGVLLVACSTTTSPETVPATLTLAPNVSRTPRFTATPIPTRTPLPTYTFTPSETTIPPSPSNTPSPTVTPPITGSVNSLQSINMRSGPGVNFDAVEALKPATRVQILGRNNDGTWLNIRLEDGNEGWVSSDLIRLQPTETPFPSLTPSPNGTTLAQGTTLPTALFGGGTITPTPPLSISNAQSPTPVIENANPATVTGLQLPNLEAIDDTATALAGGGFIPEVNVTLINVTPNGAPIGGPTGGPLIQSPPTVTPPPGTIAARTGVDVLAYCDDRSFGSPPPNNLAAGSTIDEFWNLYATTQQHVHDDVNAATYDVRLDGNPLDYKSGQGAIKQENGQWVVYWFVRSQPLLAGQHQISYKVTWSREIYDGAKQYGPGSSITEQDGTCNFTVH